MENKFKTDIVNLKSLNRFRFIIPTYQRPYVWEDEHLKVLLDDFYQSFKNDANSIYYLGSFITKENAEEAELVDGQQRFTSLWIVSLVFSQICPDSELSRFLKKDGELRLSFEIRNEVYEYLTSLLDNDKRYREFFNSEYIKEQPYLKKIADALAFISGYIKQSILKTELLHFGNYIYNNVRLIKNATAPKTDLNKLFSIINSSGVQLEQTDIVKANLLKQIDEKVLFGRIWETCENMSGFFERNAEIAFPESDWKSIHLENHLKFDPFIFKHEKDGLNENTTTASLKIDDIDVEQLNDYEYNINEYNIEKDRESSIVNGRSILNFGQFLLHTYRLHLYRENREDFKGAFDVSRLIEVFKEMEERNDPEEIKRFFHLLWEVRYLFDKYIVKWISDADTRTEHLELVKINRNTDNKYYRTKLPKSDILMLQSVLYFTGDYLRQYWLTPYLSFLVENHSDLAVDDSKLLNALERFDNVFSITPSRTDKELSWDLLDQNYNQVPDFNIENYLNNNKGTGFKHYWFQKLEYVLWKTWESKKNEQYQNYRISSKNSIEHIYPQNPENKGQQPEIEEKALHSFGNLVLLSVSQNSEYSNKPVEVKRSMFNAKRDSFDTLKSFFVFSKEQWTSVEIEEHKDQMIKKLLDYYQNA